MFTVIASPSAPHQLDHQAALIEGLKYHGIQSSRAFSVNNVKTNLVACWGWRAGKILLEKGHRVLVMERGYIGDRFKYSSLAWDGLNGHGYFPFYETDGGKRFIEHGGIIKPWNCSGQYGLILGQVPGDQSLQGNDLIPWYEEKAKQITDIYNIPAIFRQHPDLTRKNIFQTVTGAIIHYGTLQEALSKAAFTVCFNSNSSVDSVLAGIPTIVGDRGSMAWTMAGKEIGQIVTPDRELWAHSLAWKQWSLEEIKSGQALFGIINTL